MPAPRISFRAPSFKSSSSGFKMPSFSAPKFSAPKFAAPKVHVAPPIPSFGSGARSPVNRPVSGIPSTPVNRPPPMGRPVIRPTPPPMGGRPPAIRPTPPPPMGGRPPMGGHHRPHFVPMPYPVGFWGGIGPYYGGYGGTTIIERPVVVDGVSYDQKVIKDGQEYGIGWACDTSKREYQNRIWYGVACIGLAIMIGVLFYLIDPMINLEWYGEYAIYVFPDIFVLTIFEFIIIVFGIWLMRSSSERIRDCYKAIPLNETE